MAFRAQDLCKTTRRVAGSSRRRLYPRLLRDDRLVPRIGMAIRLFETKLGLRRGELPADTLLHLFQEPRLARCLVACLGRSYRYRARPLTDVIGRARAGTLAARGLATPFDLRALAYERANERHGYVPPGETAAFLATLVPELDGVEAETALWLDAPDQAVLSRIGPVPTAEEVRALYNLRVLETLLRAAEVVHLEVRGDAASIAAVCRRYGVEATTEAGWTTVHGQPGVPGVAPRQGVLLARAIVTLLATGQLGPGDATVRLGDQTYDVHLDRSLLRAALPARGWVASETSWPAIDALLEGLQTARRQGRLAGWRMRRWPNPVVGASAALWPELTLTHGDETLALLPVARATGRDWEALAEFAARRPLVALADLVPDAIRRDTPPGLTILPLTGETVAADLVAHLATRVPTAEAAGPPAWVTALADAARAAGSLGEAELASRLACAEEQVADRLAPLAATSAGVVYIDGFGLCAEDFLVRARAVLVEESQRATGRLDLGTLGRRLRVLTGRNEGLHALIAHLAGELRPVA